jgi:deoxyribonuclease IV
MPRRPRSLVGAHVMVSGGLAKAALPYLREIGAEVVQVFLSNPRGWAQSSGDPAQDEAFSAGTRGARVPVFVHAPYLVNFASPNPTTLSRSSSAVAHSLARGRAVGARGVVVHAGSSVDGGDRGEVLMRVKAHLGPLVDALDDDDPDLLVELTCGGRGSVASTPDHLPDLLEVLGGHPKVGVCLDTCHAMAAGFDLARPGELRSLLSAVARQAGPGRLRLVHANDSKDPAGSTRDRHERVGQGTIGTAPFGELFVHPATRGVPVLVETPGGTDGQRADLALLRGLRDR